MTNGCCQLTRTAAWTWTIKCAELATVPLGQVRFLGLTRDELMTLKFGRCELQKTECLFLVKLKVVNYTLSIRSDNPKGMDLRKYPLTKASTHGRQGSPFQHRTYHGQWLVGGIEATYPTRLASSQI